MRRFLNVAAFLLVIGGARIALAEEPDKDANRAAKIAERGRLWAEAQKLQAEGKNAESVVAAQKMIAIEQELFGKDHAELISSWSFIANIAEIAEVWTNAGEARAEALRIAMVAYGKSDWRTTDTRLARENLARLRGLSAEDRQALRAATENNSTVVRLYSAAKYDEAVKLATEVLQTRERLLDPEHPDTATSLNNLAELYRSQGNYAAAEPLQLRALRIREKALGPEHPETATRLNNLARLYFAQANYAAAEPLFLRALKIREKVLDPEHPDTAASLNNLALLFANQGNYAAAEPLYQRALRISEKALGPEHPETATSLDNLAGMYFAQANYAAAEPLCQRALRIREKVLGPENSDTATSLNNLALLYKKQGNDAAAEPLYRRALKVDEKVFGSEHPLTAVSLNNLAGLYEAQGNDAVAEPLYQRALKIRETTLGSEHPSTATSLNNLAGLYYSQGNYAAAEPLYQRALKINEKALGSEHPSTATSLNNLAILYGSQGNYAAAETLYLRALKIRVKVLGAEHPDTAASFNNLGLLRWQATGSKAARPLIARGLEIQLGRLERESGVQTERQQLAAMQKAANHFNAWLTVTSADAASAAEAWRYVVTWKGLTTTRQRALKRALNDDQTYAEYRGVGQRLSRLALSPPSAPSDPKGLAAWRDAAPELRRHWRESKASLELDLQRLEKELARKSLMFRQFRQTSQATPALVQTALAAAADATALVDLIEYWYIGRAAEPSEWRIAAFVVRHDGEVARVELGARDPIERQIAAWRASFGRGHDRTDPGAALRAALWQPLAAPLDGIDTVLISPDGVLGQLPWGALPGQKSGEYLLEERPLAVIPTPQLLPDLLDDLRTPGAPRSLLLAGDIDYAGDAGAPGASADLPADSRAPGRLQEGKLLSFDRLEAAQAELASIERRYLKKVREGKSDTLEGAAATEEAFREQAGQHEWLHLITHGFFAPETIGSALRAAGDKSSTSETMKIAGVALPTVPAAKPVSVHPGLLSGLAFAGANSTPEEGKDDGILTALEVSALDLSQVDTVVLSACETGLGEVAGGEGLLGLQRAFQVAGAKTVVASLWKVPDRATSTLMQRFYENLWDKKMGKLAALREAQIWMMRDKGNRGLALGDDAPDPNAPLPPFFWAAFVLSGDWR